MEVHIQFDRPCFSVDFRRIARKMNLSNCIILLKHLIKYYMAVRCES